MAQQNDSSADRLSDSQTYGTDNQPFGNQQADNPDQNFQDNPENRNYGHRFTSAAVPHGVDPDLPYTLPTSMNPLAHPAVEGRPMLQFRVELDRSMEPNATTVGMLIALRANVALLPDAGHGMPHY